MDWVKGLLIAAALPLAWKLGSKAIASYLANQFEKFVNLLLEMGDDEWDKILLSVVEKIEKEIPNDIDDVHPKIRSVAEKVCSRWAFLSGQEDKVSAALVRVVKAIDEKARKTQEG